MRSFKLSTKQVTGVVRASFVASTIAIFSSTATAQMGGGMGGNGGGGGGGGGNTATDITNTIFTALSADCSTYVDTYEATALDVNNTTFFTADIDIVLNGTTSCDLSSDAIPNHDFNDGTQSFPNTVAEINRTFSIPQNPTIAATASGLTQQAFDVVMLNGVVVDMLSAGCWNGTQNVLVGCNPANDDWMLDPVGSGLFGEDSHNAHAQPDGTYHYHGDPNAMFDDSPGLFGSPVIGFAADGFPIYGTYFLDSSTNTVRKAVSGYTLISGTRPSGPGGTYDGTYIDDFEFTDAGDLDECNGMTVSGNYGYYVTEAYPWILNCHSGTPDSSFDK